MTTKDITINDSKARVALELAKHIALNETENKDRHYWLKLYAQCYQATSGDDIKLILKAAQDTQ